MSEKTLHVSLHVADIHSAVERYRAILGIEPAKVHPDYAKFELPDPPLVLSINLGGTPGTVAHLGIRHADTAHVGAELGRLEARGLELLDEGHTTCCYAHAEKFWVKDADGMPWEMYAVTGDSDIHGAGRAPAWAPSPETAHVPGGSCCPAWNTCDRDPGV